MLTLLFSWLELLIVSTNVKLVILLLLSLLAFFLNFLIKPDLLRFKAESNALEILESKNAI